MTDADDKTRKADGSELMALMAAIADGKRADVLRMLDVSPGLARQAVVIGASRQAAADHFFDQINHYAYAGDTPLHFAAAAYDIDISAKLIEVGADVRAKNRRGAEPLHYAVDGNPVSETWDPAAQSAMVEFLIKAGADPNALDKSGVTPLHRAVRTRSTAAVRTLLASGANPRLFNGSGSTPLHLAVQNTGRGGSGSPATQAQQREIILLLMKHGSRPTDKNSGGKSVSDSAGSQWVRDVLESL